MSSIKSFVFLCVVALSLTACSTTAENTYKPISSNNYLGQISSADLQKKFSVFDENFQTFTLSEEQKTLVKTWPSSLNIDIYFGTWCHDSQREVPKLLKVLSNNNQVTSHLYSLDRTKQDPEGKASAAGIKYTPTVIISLNGKEVGRIIENPKTDWVTDINALVVNQ